MIFTNKTITGFHQQDNHRFSPTEQSQTQVFTNRTITGFHQQDNTDTGFHQQDNHSFSPAGQSQTHVFAKQIKTITDTDVVAVFLPNRQTQTRLFFPNRTITHMFLPTEQSQTYIFATRAITDAYFGHCQNSHRCRKWEATGQRVQGSTQSSTHLVRLDAALEGVSGDVVREHAAHRGRGVGDAPHQGHRFRVVHLLLLH